MEKIKLEVETSAERLDRYLAKSLSKKLSRSFIQKLIDGGNVLLNGKAVKRNHKINSGDKIDITVPDPVRTKTAAQNIPLNIVYEDKDVIVVNKPAGMVVHPGAGNFTGTLVNALLHHTKDLSGIGGLLRPGIVHRIDKETTGLLVVAKNDTAHKSLSEQFKAHTVKRKYVAVVRGVVQLNQGTIEAPIGRHPRDRQKMAVTFTRSRRAVTHYTVLKRFKDYTVLELSLETGRTHQIRAHMSYFGHPLVGDGTYGKRHGFERQALHAKILGFKHPVLKKYMEFESKLPEDMEGLLQDLEKKF